MATKRKGRKKLRVADFEADGEPYSEVEVKISIRILGKGITRSRLGVSVYPDTALELMARESLRSLKKENYGYNDEGVFGASLSENFNSWEDLNKEYPRIDENGRGRYDTECLKRMNAYIKASVDWALEMHRRGMEEAGIAGPATKRSDEIVM